jgi:hypothetical protein
MEGNWRMLNKTDTVKECWTVKSDSLLEGKTFLLQGNDTTIFETIRLVARNEGIFFIPTVMDQNEGQAISFRFIGDSAGVFIFENVKHDYPQRVIYKPLAENKMYAAVEGVDSGEFQRLEFYYIKED